LVSNQKKPIKGFLFRALISSMVLFKLKPGVTAQQIAELKSVGAAMVGVIPSR
jgi:hypothetical protein